MEQSYGRAERQVGAWQALKTMTKSDGLKLAVADDMTGVPIPSSALSDLTRIDSDATGRGRRCRTSTSRAGPAARCRPARTRAGAAR